MTARFGGDRRIPLEGRTFSNWYVDAYVGESRYLCRCICGTTRAVLTWSLKRGESKSCGCMNLYQNRPSRKPARTAVVKYE